MLHSTFAGGAEDTLPIDGAFADFGERVAFKAAGSGLVTCLEILDMEQHESTRIAVKVFDRVFAPEGRPEAIHLHFYQARVDGPEQLVVSHHAIINPEFEIMVVVRK